MAALFTRPTTRANRAVAGAGAPRHRGRTGAIDKRRRSLVTQVRVGWAPSRLRRVVRSPLARLVLAVTLASGGAWAVSGQLDQAQAVRTGWGTTAPVVVVVEPVAAGSPVSDSVQVQDRPVAVIPDDALGHVPDAGLAGVDLVAGEMLVASRVVGVDGVGMPEDSVAITVALHRAAPLVAPGDVVDLWATDAANQSAIRVAAAASVLDIDGEQLTVTVPADQAESVAVASLRPLTLARVG